MDNMDNNNKFLALIRKLLWNKVFLGMVGSVFLFFVVLGPFYVYLMKTYIDLPYQEKGDLSAFQISMEKYERMSVNDQLLFNFSRKAWQFRRAKAIAQAKRQIQTLDTWGNLFFQINWEPTFSCELEERIGLVGDGGKWVCNPLTLKSKHKVLAYSIGSNNDFSFEEALYGLYGKRLEVHTIDFTDYSKFAPPYVKYHTYKLTAVSSQDSRSLYDLIKELKHTKQTIDILKMDIEGYEYEVLRQAIKDGAFKQIDQLLVEVHVNPGHVTPLQIHEIFSALYNEDFEIYHKEPNLNTGGWCVEFAFVRVKW